MIKEIPKQSPSLEKCIQEGFSFFKINLDQKFLKDFQKEILPMFRRTDTMQMTNGSYRTDIPVQITRLPREWVERINTIIEQATEDKGLIECIKQFEWSAHKMSEGDFFDYHHDCRDFGVFEILIWITYDRGHEGRSWSYGVQGEEFETVYPKTGDALIFNIVDTKYLHGTSPFIEGLGECITLTGGTDIIRNGPDKDTFEIGYFDSEIEF